jgi:hypothetical protein
MAWRDGDLRRGGNHGIQAIRVTERPGQRSAPVQARQVRVSPRGRLRESRQDVPEESWSALSPGFRIAAAALDPDQGPAGAVPRSAQSRDVARQQHCGWPCKAAGQRSSLRDGDVSPV